VTVSDANRTGATQRVRHAASNIRLKLIVSS
jgi:hypothetical protein